MRTNFSPAQLADPRIADANRILETCVHYGFCTNVCPTYVVTGDENDSPRGRIDLIHAMLERGGAPSSKTVHHLDRCLSCLACITTCAVKVDYAHLIDHARSHSGVAEGVDENETAHHAVLRIRIKEKGKGGLDVDRGYVVHLRSQGRQRP